MPNVVDTDNLIQGMLSHAAMMSSQKKAQKLSAYEADPITVDDCLRSKNWETPRAGNSWKDAILNEIGNLMKFFKDVIALTAKHRLGLRAFDCTAAYLQAELKKPLYARPPKGLMSVLQKEMGGELGTNASDVWKLRKALYGYAGSCRLWWDKVSAWLRNYGFRALGNSGTFMVLDRRNADEESMQGIILLNLYSDDGLASIDPLG